MKRLMVLLAVAGLVWTSAGRADEIGYVEDFALAKDRTAPLKQLIPGTEDYYYYHCLHFQNTEQFDKVDELLEMWIKRHNYTQRVRQILNRQALLTYEKNPAKSLEYIRQQLGLQFNHQRETVGHNPNLPTALDETTISRETLTKLALARHQNLQGFEDRALFWMSSTKLTPDQRRFLLQRLTRPDVPNLPQLIVDDLNYQYSQGFGSMPIHGALLLAQLDETLKLKPDLLNQTNFVNTYLTKLRPSDDVDWRHDAKAREAYFDRLWSFVEQLAPVHNSLKAHVLYHRMQHDRALGVYDKERFMAYIKLPRHVSYINADFMKLDDSQRWPANLDSDFYQQTLLPPVYNDEPLVRSYLHQFFVRENAYKEYEAYINDLYLKHNFAETKIVNGLGEPEQWYSLLPPEMYQALKERIDLDFAPSNAVVFAADAAVSLDLDVKNVASLIVNVYEINTDSYYRQNLSEVDTDVSLDGLIANDQATHKYDEPPLRRVRRHFEFPNLDKPGVYVIDFIGNGKSSRVVVRKGKLRYLVRATSAGHLFTVLDEKNRRLPDAAIWLAGHLYEAEENGEIVVPYSNNPGVQPIVLSHGEFSSLAHFQQLSENYELAAGIYVDRESLLKQQKSTVVVRPALRLNGTPVTLSVLEDVRLEITSTDHDGVTTTKEVADFKLAEGHEASYEFQVPARLASIQFVLRAKVQNLSQNEKQDLQAAVSFSLNAIDTTDKIHDLHLLRIDGKYFVDLLGKSGESLADHAAHLEIKHREFTDVVHVSLQSNKQGRIALGALTEIASVTARTPEDVRRSWILTHDEHSHYDRLNAQAGQAIDVPYMGSADKPTRDEVSLLETRGGSYVADHFDALSIENGFWRIAGLPPGDYELLLKTPATRIQLHVTEGETRDGFVLGENRQLELRGQDALQITSVAVDDETIKIQLRNNSKFARVHVVATRYLPAYLIQRELGRIGDRNPSWFASSKIESLYVAGRNIGDEYRYILERKLATRFPGVMLDRPSLLLNPWAIRSTETSEQLAELGDLFDPTGEVKGIVGQYGGNLSLEIASGREDFADLDFLAQPSVTLLNLAADEEGVVSVPRELLRSHQQIHVVAVDPRSTVYRSLTLPESKSDMLDLRLARGFDPAKHFTQQNQVTVVKPKDEFTMADITSSRFEAYDSLPRVYALYASLTQNPTLIEFGFVLNWHKLKTEEKQKQYSKYACHELNFFIAQKDREFFEKVVEPYLRNKKDKTFLDQWLVGDELSHFLEPWNFAQLNTVERILLSQRIKDEREHTSRLIVNQVDLLPPDNDRATHLFNTALKGTALDTDDDFGIETATRAEADKVAQELHLLNSPDVAYDDAMPEANDMPSDSLSENGQAANGRPGLKANENAGKELEQLANQLKRRAGVGEQDGDGYFSSDAGLRKSVAQYYSKLDKTQEWVENNYYHLPIENQNAELVTANAFWRDFASHDPASSFFSTNLAEASHNFTEMMFALSVLDLPFESAEHKTAFDGPEMTLAAGSSIIVFHEEIREAKAEIEKTPILVSQNFFRHNDRYQFVNNQRLDKFVDDEFLVHAVYGCQVVVTNPTSTPQSLDVLLQVPVGAIPVLNGKYTRSVHADLPSFHTQTVDYYFYFPAAGAYQHYPVQVAKNEQLLGFAEPVTLKVVNEFSKIDRDSWQYISQHGSSEDVLAHLKNNNLLRTDLDKIAFRMGDQRFFATVIELLATRHVYNHTLWSYGIKHDHAPAVRQFLQHADPFVSQCGDYLESRLLTIDPVARKSYQHMDYRPLVNARSHQLGRRRQILNDRFVAQYHRLLGILSQRRALSDDDLMAVTYYMLLQDRIEEALEFFARVNADKLATKLQYDYFAAYVAMYKEDTATARETAKQYVSYPVDRWRNAFMAITSQLDEIDGAAAKVIDDEDREQKQTDLAAKSAGFDFQVEAKKVTLNYQNLARVDVHYYLMDIELLFSRNPFVQSYGGQFSYIRPNMTQTVELPADKTSLTFDLPESLHSSNVLVEISGGGQSRSQAYYSNSLAVQLIGNYGQLRVTHADSNKPLPKTYVKVYARMQDGGVRFYKDGYTDLRGRFDYTSLNTNELDAVQQFSLLVLNEDHGAVVREAQPPKR